MSKKLFKIRVEKIYPKIFEVEAEDEDEAMKFIIDNYDSGSIMPTKEMSQIITMDVLRVYNLKPKRKIKIKKGDLWKKN